MASNIEFERFKEMWYNNKPTIWCAFYQHPLHRICGVTLTYEDLPEPFTNAVEEPHIGKSGDIVNIKPITCFVCKGNIRNGGICDPL